MRRFLGLLLVFQAVLPSSSPAICTKRLGRVEPWKSPILVGRIFRWSPIEVSQSKPVRLPFRSGGGDRHVRNGCCWFISPRFFSGTGRNPADSKKPTFIDIFPQYSMSSSGDLDEWYIEIFLEWVRNLSRDRDDFEIRYRWERLGPGEVGTRDVAIRRSARKGARA